MFLEEHRPDLFADAWSCESSKREHSAVKGHNNVDGKGVSKY
jgi:hypothetical protein